MQRVGQKVRDRVLRGGGNDLTIQAAGRWRAYSSCPEEIGRLAEDVGKHMNIAESGYAFTMNNCSDVGQKVFRLHVGGGRKMGLL